MTIINPPTINDTNSLTPICQNTPNSKTHIPNSTNVPPKSTHTLTLTLNTPHSPTPKTPPFPNSTKSHSQKNTIQLHQQALTCLDPSCCCCCCCCCCCIESNPKCGVDTAEDDEDGDAADDVDAARPAGPTRPGPPPPPPDCMQNQPKIHTNPTNPPKQ